jgi:hypothetical protein
MRRAARAATRPSTSVVRTPFLRSPKDELKTGTLHAICSQLGIKVADL